MSGTKIDVSKFTPQQMVQHLIDISRALLSAGVDGSEEVVRIWDDALFDAASSVTDAAQILIRAGMETSKSDS